MCITSRHPWRGVAEQHCNRQLGEADVGSYCREGLSEHMQRDALQICSAAEPTEDLRQSDEVTSTSRRREHPAVSIAEMSDCSECAITDWSDLRTALCIVK